MTDDFKCPEGWIDEWSRGRFRESPAGDCSEARFLLDHDKEYHLLSRKQPAPMPDVMPKLEVGMTAENEKDIFTIKKLEDNGGGHQKVYFFRQFKGNDWCCSCSIRTLWDRDGKEIWRRGV